MPSRNDPLGTLSKAELSVQLDDAPLDSNDDMESPQPNGAAVLSMKTLTPHHSQQTKSFDSERLRVSKDYGTIQQNGSSSSKLHRIYSENETANFNSFDGRRMYDDDRHRPHRTRHYETQLPSDSLKRVAAMNSSRSFQSASVKRDLRHAQIVDRVYGMEDEYIPDFDFSTAVQQWTDSYYANGDNRSSFETSSYLVNSTASSDQPVLLGELHALVGPVSVPKPGHQHVDEEDFIVSKLPRNFSDLPFSVRRKLMSELSLSPQVSRDSIDRIVKKRFKRSKNESSPALQFLSSFSEKSRDNKEEVVLEHTMGRIIGSGAWGIIRECRDKTGMVRAMKVIRAKNESVKDVFRRETQVWSCLKHSNILPLINVKETHNAFFCLTNKANGGTLFDLVAKWGVYISQDSNGSRIKRLRLTKHYSIQVMDALIYMHNTGIVHGDVKLENCLLDFTGDSSNVLLCDFGMSLKFKQPVMSDDITLGGNRMIKRRPSIPRSHSGPRLKHPRSLERIVQDKSKVHDDTRLQLRRTDSSESDILSFDPSPIMPKTAEVNPNLPDPHIGSLPYAAPELLESCPPPLGPSADVWAMGVLMYTMIVGKLPFQHDYEPRLRAMISAAKYDHEALQLATNGNAEFVAVVEGCLTKDLTRRLTLDEAHVLIEQVAI